MKHALLPWRFEKTCAGTIGVFPKNDGGSNPFAVCHIGKQQRTPAEEKEIAEFIVKACNNHDDLLAACKTLLTICNWKCSPLDNVILTDGRTNERAIIDAMDAIQRVDGEPGPTGPQRGGRDDGNATNHGGT